MRRFVALLSAGILVVSLAGSSLAAGPVVKVDRVVGQFDMADNAGTLLGHVSVNFTNPSAAKLVPGTLDITWAPSAVNADPAFPFMVLRWPPVKESHAQLLASWFGDEMVPNQGRMTSGGASGYLCDYTAPWNSGCREFQVVFQHYDNPAWRDVTGWAVTKTNDLWDFGGWYHAVNGKFVVTYAGPTE
jgi:hypothetical protein